MGMSEGTKRLYDLGLTEEAEFRQYRQYAEQRRFSDWSMRVMDRHGQPSQ